MPHITIQRPPEVTAEIVAYLDRIYPNMCPRPADSEREIWMAVGARLVVAHMETLLERQHEVDDLHED